MGDEFQCVCIVMMGLGAALYGMISFGHDYARPYPSTFTPVDARVKFEPFDCRSAHNCEPVDHVPILAVPCFEARKAGVLAGLEKECYLSGDNGDKRLLCLRIATNKCFRITKYQLVEKCQHKFCSRQRIESTLDCGPVELDAQCWTRLANTNLSADSYHQSPWFDNQSHH